MLVNQLIKGDQLDKTDERQKIGRNASAVAISGNTFLTIFNFIIGSISGSSALVAESAHTLSDVLTSIIAFIGFKIGMKPADEDHQYGHGRAEPLVGLVIVVFLVIVAYEILSGVYIKLTSTTPLAPPELIAALMAFIGIFINLAMTIYLMRAGKENKQSSHNSRWTASKSGYIFMYCNFSWSNRGSIRFSNFRSSCSYFHFHNCY